MYTHAQNEISFIHKKEGYLAICNGMERSRGNYVKLSQTEKFYTLWFHLYVPSKTKSKNKKKNTKIPNLKDTGDRLVVARGRDWEVGKK